MSLIQRYRRHRFSVDKLGHSQKTPNCACHRFSVDSFVYPQVGMVRHRFSVDRLSKFLKKNNSQITCLLITA